MSVLTDQQIETIASSTTDFQSICALLGPGGQGGYGGETGQKALEACKDLSNVHHTCTKFGIGMGASVVIDGDLAELFANAIRYSGSFKVIAEPKIKKLAADLGISDELEAKLT